MPDLTGKIFNDRYRINNFLSKGGMAEVYQVWDKQRSVHLAMKVMHPKLARRSNFVKDFRQEAKTLSELQHPNIVRFYGIEESQGHVFLLMDYIEGSSLRDQISKTSKPLNPQFILRSMQQICTALNYAHQNGIVHCDVKPANILINQEGNTLVSDFGIARWMGERSSGISTSNVGTPAYMAPEQNRGQNLSAHTDVYALGVLLFEMLSGGRRPFTGEKATNIAGSTRDRVRWEHQYIRPPSIRNFVPEMTAELEAVVMKCLEKDPNNRFSSTLDLLRALEQAIGRFQHLYESRYQPSSEKFGPEAKPVQESKSLIPMVGMISIILLLAGAFLYQSPDIDLDFPRIGEVEATVASPPFVDEMFDLEMVPFRMYALESIKNSLESGNVTLLEGVASSLSPSVSKKGRMSSPGSYTYEITLPQNEIVVWNWGWCALTDTVLEDNLGEIEFQFQVDNQYISLDRFVGQKFVGDPRTPSCFGYSALLSDWNPGSHVLKTIIFFPTSISDGVNKYPAGTRSLIYEVDVVY